VCGEDQGRVRTVRESASRGTGACGRLTSISFATYCASLVWVNLAVQIYTRAFCDFDPRHSTRDE
jgi:hypothetical protein